MFYVLPIRPRQLLLLLRLLILPLCVSSRPARTRSYWTCKTNRLSMDLAFVIVVAATSSSGLVQYDADRQARPLSALQECWEN